MYRNSKGKQVLAPSNISTRLSNEQETVKNKQESLPAQAELIAYYMNLAEESKSNQCASSSSKDKMTSLEILEFYETHHKFSIPRKVLIHKSFCRYMLANSITKEAICELLLTKDVEDVELNVTSCDTKVLMRGEIQNKDELKACIGLALSLKELSCGHINSCLKSGDCLERFVLNENPDCYFVATKGKAFMKKLLQLPGVAVIGVRDGNMILKEPSVLQKKFVDERVKRLQYSTVTSEDKMNQLQVVNKLKGKELQIESVLGKACLTKNSSGKRILSPANKLSYADDESDGEGVTSNRRVKQKLQKNIEVENAFVTLDEDPRCRTLFMGRLNFSISEEDVRDFFKNVARVNEVRFSNRKKGARFGHVEFYTAEAAREALKLNGQKLHGHVVHLDYAKKRPYLAEMFASGNGTGRGHWGFGAGRGRLGGFGAGRVRFGRFGAGRGRLGGFGTGRGRREGRDW